MLKLVMMSKFPTNEYCEMVLIYGECRHQARAVQHLYRLPSSWRATSFNTGHQKDCERIQGDEQYDPKFSNRQAKKGRTVCATRRRISVCTRPSSEQHKRDQLAPWPHKKRIWTILNEIGTHPYKPTPVQAQMPRDAQRRYDFCNFIMNR